MMTANVDMMQFDTPEEGRMEEMAILRKELQDARRIIADWTPIFEAAREIAVTRHWGGLGKITTGQIERLHDAVANVEDGLDYHERS